MIAHTELYRAAASPVRNRILSVLRAADGPMDVHEIAWLVDIHANSVRSHLTVLKDAGVVSATPEERKRPGRPRLIYTVTNQGHEDGGQRGYRFLAGVLASYLVATATDPTRAGEEAGTAWGHYLVDAPAPFHRMPPKEGIARILALQDELGFEPELDDDHPAGSRILLRRCPFLDVAKEHQQLVCSIHLGLMRGALDELGAQVQARDLLPFVEPGLCVSVLEVHA